MTGRLQVLAFAALSSLACKPDTVSVEPGASGEESVPAGQTPVTPPIEWVGTWGALFGGTQEGATVEFDAGGGVRGRMQIGPKESCCFYGTYVAESDAISFTLSTNDCPTSVFEDYTEIWRHEGNSVVIKDPSFDEADITKDEDGLWSGAVWNFEKRPDGSSVPTCEE